MDDNEADESVEEAEHGDAGALEDPAALTRSVRPIGGGTGFSGVSQHVPQLKVMAKKTHPAIGPLRRYALGDDGEDLLFDYHTIAAFVMRFGSLSDESAKLRIFDRIISVEAIARTLDAITADAKPGPACNFTALSHTEGVKYLSAKMTSVVVFEEHDFDAVEPLPQGMPAALVKLWSQVSGLRYDQLTDRNGTPLSDNRILCDLFGALGTYGRGIDKLEGSATHAMLLELLKGMANAVIVGSSSLANQLAYKVKLTIAPTPVDDFAANQEEFLSNLHLMAEIQKGTTDAVLVRLPLALNHYRSLALALEGAADPVGATKMLAVALGSSVAITIDSLGAMDADLRDHYMDALTEALTEGVSRPAFVVGRVEQGRAAKAAHLKANPENALGNPGFAAVQQKEALKFFKDPEFVQLEAAVHALGDPVQKLRLVLRFGGNQILSAFATKRSAHSNVAFMIAAQGHTIAVEVFRTMVSTDSVGNIYPRFTNAPPVVFHPADVQNLRTLDDNKVDYFRICRNCWAAYIPGSKAVTWAKTIGRQQNFMFLCFPILQRLWLGRGLDGALIDMLYDELAALLEGTSPGDEQGAMVDAVLKEFYEAATSANQHFIGLKTFDAPRPEIPSLGSSWRKTVKTILQAGDETLRQEHCGAWGAVASPSASTLSKTSGKGGGGRGRGPDTVGDPMGVGVGGRGRGVGASDRGEGPATRLGGVEVNPAKKLLRLFKREVYDVEAVANDIAVKNAAFGRIDITRDIGHMAAFFVTGPREKRARYVAANCPARFLMGAPFPGFVASEYRSSTNFL